MKFLFVALLALTLHLPGRASAAAPFTDKNLEAAVRAVLHDTKTTPLSDTDLNNVYILEAPGKDIKDLAGLEKCTNLALLKLTKNQVADLKPLAGLKNLQSLELSHTEVTGTGLKELAGLKNLQSLHLGQTKVTDAGLKELARLKSCNTWNYPRTRSRRWMRSRD